MTKTTTLQAGKNSNGCPVRLQQRGTKFDVVYCTGFCWKYIAKAVSEQAARNSFFMAVL